VVHRFVKTSVFRASVEEVFAFHERPDALHLLMPPWDKTEVITPPSSLEVGTKVVLRSRVGPVWVTLQAEHVAYEKNVRFEDVMTRGPFKTWHHVHGFEEVDGGCRLTDDVHYDVGWGPLGQLANWVEVRGRLKKLFDFRHEVTRKHVEGDAAPT
jgi:ligand-binding SRPBCC domain-containing protein